jgi:hypothetical protein
MRIILPILLCVGLAGTVAGQKLVPRGGQPTRTRPRAEVSLAKAVARITARVEGFADPLNGTGFIVGIVDSRLPENRVFSYLVTNRHIAAAMFSDASGNVVSHHIREMKAIVNLKTVVNGSKAHEIDLPPQGQFRWQFPENPSIDLAAIPIKVDDSFDIEQIGVSLFMTEDRFQKLGITPGDKVMTCGYFVHYAGAHQFQPIVREGSLAMVPDDVMNVPIGGQAKVYLADLHIIPGNSGSPLFLAPAFTLGGMVYSKNGIPYGLLGVVSGYMWEDDKLTLHAATDYEGIVHANSGIAIIVPVDQVKDLIDHPEFKRQRDLAVQRLNGTN